MAYKFAFRSYSLCSSCCGGLVSFCLFVISIFKGASLLKTCPTQRRDRSKWKPNMKDFVCWENSFSTLDINSVEHFKVKPLILTVYFFIIFNCCICQVDETCFQKTRSFGDLQFSAHTLDSLTYTVFYTHTQSLLLTHTHTHKHNLLHMRAH